MNEFQQGPPALPPAEVRFANLKPIKSAPLLLTLNGFGLTIYGHRDADAPTGTYVKTRVLSALFLPVIALDAFRVMDAPGGGYYFIGRERLSALARGWNACVLVAILSLIGMGAWQNHINSPAYRLEQALAEVRAFEQQQRGLDAARVYARMIQRNLGNTAEHGAALEKLVRAEVASGDPKRCMQGLVFIRQNANLSILRLRLMPDLAGFVLDASKACADPREALALLGAFTPTAMDEERVAQARMALLERVHADHPDDLEVRIELALAREQSGKINDALILLEPAASLLADGEGARLFGELLVENGRYQEAIPYLERYTGKRAKALNQAERHLNTVYDTARTRELENLNRTGGPRGFLDRYKSSTDEQKASMVEEYLSEKLRDSPGLVTARNQLQKAAAVIPVLMQLGVAQLRTAQESDDPPRAKEMLAKAEQSFLSIRGYSGDSDEYRYFLGQVYFWSGREAEGRKLFDELLERHKNDCATLYGLASIYRELGEEGEARKLLDLAFESATDLNQKTMVVLTRVLVTSDLDESIAWLQKADPSNPQIRVDLAQARGRKAELAGDPARAADCYRQALAGYRNMEQDAAVLNNSAILCNALYRLEGDPAHFESFAAMISEAADKSRTSGILNFNAAASQLSVAVLRLARGRIHASLLQQDGGIDSLRFLYDSEGEKKQVVEKLEADPNFRKSVKYFWDAILLAPKNADIYKWGAQLFHFIDDDESLKRLAEKAAAQQFDFKDRLVELEDCWAGKQDANLLSGIKAARQTAASTLQRLEDPRDRAMAQVLVADAWLAGYAMSEDLHEDLWLKDLRQAAELVPCSRTRDGLQRALEAIAVVQLESDIKECHEFIKASRKRLDCGSVLRILLQCRGPLGDKVRAHPAVAEVRRAASADFARFPGGPGISAWLAVEASDAAACKQAVKSDLADRLVYQIIEEVEPECPSTILAHIWRETLDDHPAEAAEWSRKLGRTLPHLPDEF